MNSGQNPGLYIHVPFCRSKCLYCDFYSIASRTLIPSWLDAVRREAGLYRERFPAFDSLFLGGGTPSLLDEHQLAALLEGIRSIFSFLPGSEMSMEANPDSLTVEKLKVAGALGINRISLGVQSLDDDDLKYLGRPHNAAQSLEAVDAIRSCGFDNLGIDLIYGLETQSLRGWRKTLDRVLQFRPEHISCYQLTLEKGTPFWKMKAEGRVHPIGEKMAGAFFIWTSRYLEKHGYIHCEISNFARGPERACRHNLKYWSHAPYLGLGPSAHSFQAGRRWWNVKSVREYCRLLAEGRPPVEDSEVLSSDQLELESLALGLRTKDGASLYGQGGVLRSNRAIEELQKSGLARVRNGRIQPTRKGFLVADSLPLMFCR